MLLYKPIRHRLYITYSIVVPSNKTLSYVCHTIRHNHVQYTLPIYIYTVVVLSYIKVECIVAFIECYTYKGMFTLSILYSYHKVSPYIYTYWSLKLS